MHIPDSCCYSRLTGAPGFGRRPSSMAASSQLAEKFEVHNVMYCSQGFQDNTVTRSLCTGRARAGGVGRSPSGGC